MKTIKGYQYRLEMPETVTVNGAVILTTKQMWVLYEGNTFVDSFDTELELIEWVNESEVT